MYLGEGQAPRSPSPRRDRHWGTYGQLHARKRAYHAWRDARPIDGGGPPQPGQFWGQAPVMLAVVAAATVPLPCGIIICWDGPPTSRTDPASPTHSSTNFWDPRSSSMQYLWEEVLPLSWKPGSPLTAAPHQGLMSLPFRLVYSSLA